MRCPGLLISERQWGVWLGDLLGYICIEDTFLYRLDYYVG